MVGHFNVLIVVIISICVMPVTGGYADSFNPETGIYTNMYYNDEGGDVLGVELFLVYSQRGYIVLFQGSEGIPSVPVVASAEIKGKSISFEIPGKSGYVGEFQGHFTDTGIVGQFKGGLLLNLKYGKSYWQ